MARCVVLLLVALVGFAASGQKKKLDMSADSCYRNVPNVIYHGIDISDYQDNINWESLADNNNIRFVYHKATEGTSHRQRQYRQRNEQAHKHGILVGSYHFLRTAPSIDSQFRNFTNVVKKEEQDLIPLLDVEYRRGWTDVQLRDSVKKFCDLLEAHYGVKPMIYTSSSFFNDYLGEMFADYPLFIARYSLKKPQLRHGAKWILWQFSERAVIDGIDAFVDLSRFNAGCGVNDIKMKKSRKVKFNNSGNKNQAKPKSSADNAKNRNVPPPAQREKKDRKPVPPKPDNTKKSVKSK